MTEPTMGEHFVRRFAPYPKYRHSGVEWLGDIPNHWDLEKARWLFGEIVDRSHPAEPLLSVTQSNGVLPRDDAEMRVWNPGEDVSAYKLVVPGDFVISLRSFQGGIEYSGCRGILSPAYTVLRRRVDLDDGYFRHLLKAQSFVSFLNLQTTGIRQGKNISYDDFAVLPCPVPPAAEQRAIAVFLDRETAKIDTLVAKKERLIELLQEKRTALITHAVTQGLDQSVLMKDSGVEWLGEIPAHWDVAPVYSRYEVALGKMLDVKRVTGEALGRYLRNVDVQWDRVDIEDLPEMDFAPWERDRYSLRSGDLLVCEGGEVGRTAIWRDEISECFYQKAIHRVRPRTRAEDPRFFYYLMYSLAKRGVFVAGGNPNTIDHLTAVKLRHYRLPFASPEEQRAIAGFLDHETTKIDALVAKVRDAIDRLKELRTALISSAVTGKIDVRQAMA